MMISSYEGKIYFFISNDGIYEIQDSRKIKRIINYDEKWGEIKDMSVYNGNIYLLDIKKDEVYKYFPTNNGFSEKNSYFKSGEAIDLSDANSLTIDGSLYIGFSKFIQKFTSGIKELFKNNFPNKNIQIEKIYTDREISKIYVWDKSNGLIYILKKDGEYQGQISSNIINTATDFIVYNNKLLFLNKNKIYFIE